MSAPQRVTLAIYCMMLAYCFAWVPWRTAAPLRYARIGYGWIWRGPASAYGNFAAPDVYVIALRVFAITAIAGSIMLVFPLLPKRAALLRLRATVGRRRAFIMAVAVAAVLAIVLGSWFYMNREAARQDIFDVIAPEPKTNAPGR
jgi:hypothetical protein